MHLMLTPFSFSTITLKLKKMLKHFTFVFHEVDPHLPCVVINETHVVPTSSNGLSLWSTHLSGSFPKFWNSHELFELGMDA
jgi:hypothetical protein